MLKSGMCMQQSEIHIYCGGSGVAINRKKWHTRTIVNPLFNLLQLVIDGLRAGAFNECKEAIDVLFKIEYMAIIPDKLFFKMEPNANGMLPNISFTACIFSIPQF